MTYDVVLTVQDVLYLQKKNNDKNNSNIMHALARIPSQAMSESGINKLENTNQTNTNMLGSNSGGGMGGETGQNTEMVKEDLQLKTWLEQKDLGLFGLVWFGLVWFGLVLSVLSTLYFCRFIIFVSFFVFR